MNKKVIFGAIGALVCAACYKAGQISMGCKVVAIGIAVHADVQSGRKKVTDLSKCEASCLLAVVSESSWERSRKMLASLKEGESDVNS